MRETERTRQQLDPAGSAGSLIATIALCAVAFGYAIIMTLKSLPHLSNEIAGFAAVALLGVACAAATAYAEPLRSPFRQREHFFVVLVLLAAVLVEALSQFGSDTLIGDNWGPLCLSIVLVAISPYRPPSEIVFTGVVSSVFIGFVTLLEVHAFVTDAPMIAFVLVAVTPVLCMSIAAAVFSHKIITSIERWQSRARRRSGSLEKEFRDGIARSVQQDRVTILSRDVLPFFSDLLKREYLGDDDRDRAREIADSIRRVMVEEVDRSWLENIVGLSVTPTVCGAAEHSATSSVVDDPDRVAAAMAADQRTALRALVVALLDSGADNASRADQPSNAQSRVSQMGMRVSLEKYGDRCCCSVAVQLGLNDYAMRSMFAPYFAVMRSAFPDFEVLFAPPALTLRFSYDHD